MKVKYPKVAELETDLYILGKYETEKNQLKVTCVHSCKRCAQFASLAVHSTTSPVLRCKQKKKHYSRLMLIGIALFRLHAQEEEKV